jgi:hypothetical protein
VAGEHKKCLYAYEVPGWPRVIKGRTDLMTAFREYVDNIALQSADKLIVHNTDDGRVVVIEYEVHEASRPA